MEASSSAKLIIGIVRMPFGTFHDEDSNALTKLDDKILSFHNLGGLTHLQIRGCRNLSCISLKGFKQLISLKSLEIEFCRNLFSSDVLPEHVGEDMADAGSIALPSLERLNFESCGITGKWLSVMLQHAPALEELSVDHCEQLSGLLIEGTGRSLPNHTCTPHDSSAGNPDGTTSAALEGLLRVPSNLVSSLKKIIIKSCYVLTFQGNKEGFSGFTSLEELMVCQCPELIPSLVQKYQNNDQGNGRWLLPHSLCILEIDDSPEMLQPCFLKDGNCLEKLVIEDSPSLECLQLCFCTALEELIIDDCKLLAALEGNLTCLRKLVLSGNSGLESLGLYSCTALEELTVENCEALTALEGNFTSLRKLDMSRNPRLKSLPLRFCTALEHLRIYYCESLDTLEGNFTCIKNFHLHDNSGLESLELYSCTSLEELTVENCEALTALKGNFTSLQKLDLWENPRLKSLWLGFCTALEHLKIYDCEVLDTLEDLRSLRGLRYVDVLRCTRLPQERLLSQGYDLCAGLERLRTDDFSFLTTSFCKCLTSLQRLEIHECTTGEVRRLTDEQERALQLLMSLQELQFENYFHLEDLPVGLYSLPSLKKLEIDNCQRISSLSEKNLPPSLEELQIRYCSKELIDGSSAGNRLLALRLSRLKELLYEADDLVDELDYCRLQDQVDEGTFGCGTNGAEQVDGSRDNYMLQHQVEGGLLGIISTKARV
nr:unnamed protein product [Digitaria exilis]